MLSEIAVRLPAAACGTPFQQLIAPVTATLISGPPDLSVIPEEQHTAGGSESGQTAHVERWNTTLRQRLARFVRKTLSFSKSDVLHEACLLLFLHRYNRDRAIILI
jgi:IS1 transposase